MSRFASYEFFNADAIANKMKCVWRWLKIISKDIIRYYTVQAIQWYLSPWNCYTLISVLYLFTRSIWVTEICKLHGVHINSWCICVTQCIYCNYGDVGFKTLHILMQEICLIEIWSLRYMYASWSILPWLCNTWFSEKTYKKWSERNKNRTF